jgi:secondary thiamine-phosphate synthase enzyme
MSIINFTISVATTGTTDIVNISDEVDQCLSKACPEQGFIHLFVPGSTAALTTLEYEQGAVADLQKAIERLAPRDIPYAHDRRWGDGNGYAHVRAALLGPSITIPVVNGAMHLGTWQQIVLCDFDNHPRNREIMVQIYAAA